MIKKVLVGVIAIIMIVGLMPVQKTSAATIEELQALIMQLQAQLAALSGGQQNTNTGYQFTRNLTLGSTGADVNQLQNVLKAGGYLNIAATTQLFGPMTKAALVGWQKAMGITPTSGYFGPLSRAKMNGGNVGGGVVIPTDSYLKVEAAGPVAGTVPSGSIYNPILKIKLSAGKDTVSVTGLTVTRGGFIANTNVTGLSVWDDMGNRYGNILTSLTSDGKASFTFGATPFTIPAGTSKYLTVSANLHASSSNGTISFSVDSVSSVIATGGAVTGTFPIIGNVMTIVDGSTSLGNVYVSSQATVGMTQTNGELSATEGNVEVGFTDQEIAKIRLVQNNSKEGVYFKSIRLWLGGSFRDTTDLKNFKLVSQEGTVVATADRAYDRYVTFNLATPYFIDKGYTRDFTVKADVLDGSGNYFYVTIQDDYDVIVKGATTGASVLALDSGGSSLTSSDITRTTDGWFKIKKGVATVSKASSSPSGNIAPGSSNVVLAKFEVKSGGEALEVRKMGVQIQNAASAPVLTGTVSVRDAVTGATYLSVSADTTGIVTSTTPTTNSLLNFQQNLSSYITVPSGGSVFLEVVGTVPQSASTGSYTVSIGQLYTKRISTNDYINLATGAVRGNTLTVQNVLLSVTKDASFANTTVSKGATGAKIGQFVLKPSSADDIRVNTINLDVTSSSNIQNLHIMDGATQLGTTKGTPTATGNSFSLSNYVLAKDTPKTISVYADVLSTAVGPVTVAVASSGISGVGVSSGKSLDATPSVQVALQEIAISTPTITISKDPSISNSKIALAGQNGVEFHKVRFEAKNEDLTLKKVTFVLSPATSTSPTSTQSWTAAQLAANFGSFELYDGSTLLKSGNVDSVNGTISISGLNVTLPKDTSKILTLKGNVATSGGLVSKSVSAIKLYSTSSLDMEIYSGQGLVDDTAYTVTSEAISTYALFHDAAPLVTNALSSKTATPSSAEPIAQYKVTNVAPAGGRSLTVEELAFTATLTGAAPASTITTFTLWDGSTQIASSTGTLSSSTPSITLTFSSSTSPSLWTTQEISAVGERIYTIKANTTNANPGGGSTTYNVRLSTEFTGTQGYLSSDTATGPEYYWNTSGIKYGYTPINGSYINGLQASDSVFPVSGVQISY